MLIGASNGAPLRGATHAFGNTEESIFLKNYGRGDGDGEYHDALHVKGNATRWTSPSTRSLAASTMARAGASTASLTAPRSKRVDHTEYVAYNATAFAAHWAQRLSAAIVFGDARGARSTASTRSSGS